MEVERIVEVEKIVEVPVEKIVEIPVERVVERQVEVPVEIERIIERRVEVPIEKIITIEKRIEIPIERIVTVEKIVEVPVVANKSLFSGSASQTEPLASVNTSPLAPNPDIGLFRVTPGTSYDFLKAPPATVRRVSADNLAAVANGSADSTKTVETKSVPTSPVNKSQPPMMNLPPPPSNPPPSRVGKKMSMGPPPLPTSPHPDDFLQRATSPVFQSTASRRASTRTAPSAAAAAIRASGGDMPPPASTSRKPSRSSFKPTASAQATPVRDDVKSRQSVRRRTNNTFVSSGYASANSSAAGHDQLTEHDRNPSLSSFDSYAGTVPKPRGVPTAGSTDPQTIHAITQTMIGEYLYKYTRRTVGKGQSSNRHKRFFWVHPYTKTLYWSTEDPGSSRASESSAKSVFISNVKVIEDTNIQPPGLFTKSIVVSTPGREIQITAPTQERHELWMSALQFLLQKQSPEANNTLAETTVRNTSRPALASIADEQGRLTMLKSPMSLRSFSSERHSLSNITPKANRSHSTMSHYPRSASTMGKRAGTAAHEYMRRHELPQSFHGGHRYKGPYKGARIVDDEFDVVSREDGEDMDISFEGLENVRACCDGKHLVGQHYHHHDHPNVPRTPARAETPSLRGWSIRSGRASNVLSDGESIFSTAKKREERSKSAMGYRDGRDGAKSPAVGSLRNLKQA